MGKIETYELSDTEIDLLVYQDFPMSPCTTCPSLGTCCGCDKETKYNQALKPIYDAGIEELYFKIREMKNMNSKINELTKELNSRIESFNEESKNWVGVEKLHKALSEWFNR